MQEVGAAYVDVLLLLFIKLATGRRDATDGAASAYDESRCKMCQQSEQAFAHRFAILTGGFVSPATYGVQTNTPITCSRGGVANRAYALAKSLPNVAKRHLLPQKTCFATPTGMVSVRRRSLSVRCK